MKGETVWIPCGGSCQKSVDREVSEGEVFADDRNAPSRF